MNSFWLCALSLLSLGGECIRRTVPEAPAPEENVPENVPPASNSADTSVPTPAPDSPAASAGGRECANERLSPRGKVHYFCDCGPGASPKCVPGDDSRKASTSGAPWRSYGKAIAVFSEMSTGETVAFCRGGSFASTKEQWINYRCRAQQPCVIRDYSTRWGDRTEDRPLLFSDGSTVLDLSSPGHATHREGYRVLNLHLRGASGSNSAGVFVYNDMDDVTLCNLVIEKFGIGVQIADAQEPEKDSDAKNERISMIGSTIRENSGIGWLGACDQCLLQENRFENNGYAGEPTNHSIYLTGAADHRGPYTVTGMKIIGNTLLKSVHANGVCQGTILVAHGQHSDLTIEGNVIREEVGTAAQGCWGIALDSGSYETPEHFNKVTIRNNEIYNVGSVSIGLTSCQDCVVENNLIAQAQPFGGVAISIPNKDRNAKKGDVETTRIKVRNNTLQFTSESGGTGIQLGTEGKDHVVVNNAIVYTGQSDQWSCFDLNLQPVGSARRSSAYHSDHNLCWYPGVGTRQPRGRWEKRVATLKAWQELGLDGNSLNSDPKLKPDGSGAIPDSRSPLVGRGDPTQSSRTDIKGERRPSRPSIGAREPDNQGGSRD